MKWFKRIIFLILLIVTMAAVAVTIIGTQYKDSVVHFVKNELGKKLNREIRVENIEFKLFSNFPNISVDLLNLETYSFEPGDTPFIKLKKVHLVFDVIPLFKGEFELGEIILEKGYVNIIYNEKEIPNFNILKENSDSNTEKSSFSIDLIELQDVSVTYNNRKKGEIYSVSFEECLVTPNSFLDSINASVNFTGKIPMIKTGDFKSQKPFDLEGNFKMISTSDSLLFYYGGKFCSGNSIIDGKLDFFDKRERWDIQVDFFNQEVLELLSILPDEFKDKSFSNSKGLLNAKIAITGERKKNKFPSLKVHFDFSKGLLKFSNHNLRDIDIKGSYFQPDITTKIGAHVKINKYSADYNGIVLKGKGTLKDFNKPLFSVEINSSFYLEHLHRLLLKEDFKTLSGKTEIDINFSGRLIDVFSKHDKKELKKFKSQGKMVFSNVISQPSDFDYPIEIESGQLNFRNQDLIFDSFKGIILNSSFSMNGRIKNFLKTLFENHPLDFDADLKMDNMILEDFISSNSDSTDSIDVNYQFNLPKSISLKTNLQLGKFSFRNFRANEIKGEILLKNQQLSFKELFMKTCDGEAHLRGYLNTINPNKIIYKCKSSLQNIDAEKAFVQFENFGQDVLQKKHVKGKISLNSFLLAESDKKLNIYKDKFYTKTKLNISKGELIYFEPLIELQGFLKEEFKLNFNLDHLKFETLKNNIEIKNGIINIPEMAIRSSDINLDIAGKHSFNQDIDYLLKIKHNEIFKANKQNKIDVEFGVIENNDKTATLPLRMRGNIDNPKFTYDTKVKRTLISDSWKKEGKEIKKVISDEFGGVFKSKKNTKKPSIEDRKNLNKPTSKTQTIITWEEEDDE